MTSMTPMVFRCDGDRHLSTARHSQREPDATDLLTRLSQPGPKWISTATLLEIQIVVISQLGEAGPAELDLLLLS